MDGDSSATAQLDIGAVEAGPVFLVESGTEGGVSLRHAMTLAAADPAPGVRIAFRADPTIFPATTIALIGGFGELALPAGKSFFLDASNLSSPVKISANASRVFNIPATSTLALHSLKIITGRAPNGPNGFSDPVSTNGTDGGSGSDRGAIFSTGLLTVTACTFADNTTGNSGQFGSSFTVGVSGNGGAIAHRGGVPCRLTACSIAYNRTGINLFSQSGEICGKSPGLSAIHAVLRNCLLGQNNGGGNEFLPLDVEAYHLTCIGRNLFSIAASVTHPVIGPAPLVRSDLRLAPLGDYGGPTQTIALRSGSSARSNGSASALTRDQRGAFHYFTL